MKKTLLLSALFFVFIASAKSEKSTIVYDILNKYVNQKVENIQQIVKFTDAQAEQLKKLELNYLLDVQKAENCWLCNSKRKVQKLKLKRNKDLNLILPRDQFIKYDAIERDAIKMNPRE